MTYLINTFISYHKEGEQDIIKEIPQSFIVDAFDEDNAIDKIKEELYKEDYEVKLQIVYINKKIV